MQKLALSLLSCLIFTIVFTSSSQAQEYANEPYKQLIERALKSNDIEIKEAIKKLCQKGIISTPKASKLSEEQRACEVVKQFIEEAVRFRNHKESSMNNDYKAKEYSIKTIEKLDNYIRVNLFILGKNSFVTVSTENWSIVHSTIQGDIFEKVFDSYDLMY